MHKRLQVLKEEKKGLATLIVSGLLPGCSSFCVFGWWKDAHQEDWPKSRSDKLKKKGQKIIM
jgi:hypothetical protein